MAEVVHLYRVSQSKYRRSNLTPIFVGHDVSLSALPQFFLFVLKKTRRQAVHLSYICNTYLYIYVPFC